MSDRKYERLGLLAAGAMVAVALLLGFRSSPVGAQDSTATQLRLELQNMKYQYDLQLRQMEAGIGRLTERVRYLETARVGDSLARHAAPPSPRSDSEPPEGDRGPEFRARRFVVEDGAGRVRAVLGMSDAHGPMLALLDEGGQIGALYRIEPLSGR